MTKINNLNNGTCSGKIGVLVPYIRRGKPYMRLAPTINPSNTPKQKSIRNKFKVSSQVLGRLSRIFTIGFNHIAKPGQTGYNTGLGYNIHSAMNEHDGEWSIDWSLVKVSCGSLANVKEVKIEPIENNKYRISWNPNNGTSASPDDLIYIALYNEQINNSLWLVNGTAQRQNLSIEIPSNPYLIPQFAHLYIFTKRKSNDLVSDSIYFQLPE